MATINKGPGANSAKSKKNVGFTLIELLVSLSIFIIVVTAAGSVIYSASKSYGASIKMMEDEYNARLALLSITREIHRGADVAEYDPFSSALTLRTYDEIGNLSFEAVYRLGSDGFLRREIIAGDSAVAFGAAAFKEFTVEIDGRWVNIKITGINGLKLETTVSLSRIPNV